MTKRVLAGMLAIAAATGIGAPSWAGDDGFDARMKPVVDEYLKVQQALAGDTLDGVPAAANAVAAAARRIDTSSLQGPHAAHIKGILADVATAADAVSQAKGIEAVREAFKKLSAPLAAWAQMAKPAGVEIAYCPMVSSKWLQKGKDVRNPYFGASMLTCGEIVTGKAAAAGHGAKMKMKMHGGD